MLLPAQDEQGGKVVALHERELAGVVLDDVVGTGAIRRSLVGELDAEHASGTILRLSRRSSADNVDSAGAGLAAVVDGDAAVVVQAVLGKDALAVAGVGSDGAGDLIPAAEVAGDVEGRIRGGIVAAAVPEGGNSVVGHGSGGREEGEDGGKTHVGRLISV